MKILYKILLKLLSRQKNFILNKILMILADNLLYKSRQSYNKINLLEDVEIKIFSQNGEDGILDYLITQMGLKKPNFIEIGVEDYSEANTRYIYEKYFSSGLIIDRLENLEDQVKSNINFWKGDIRVLEENITSENVSEKITNNCDFEVDILSLDIDGIDYWVLKNIPEALSPKIYIIEYNSIFGDELEVTVPNIKNFSRESYHHSRTCYGASLRAYINLMDKKGYYLIGVNRLRNNAFFILKKYKKEIYFKNIHELSLKEATNYLFRESRNSKGFLNFKNQKDRINDIINCEVINLKNNKKDKLIKIIDEKQL